MSITSSRPLLSLCALPMSSCEELNPEFRTEHPDDVACFAAGSGTGEGAGAMTCMSDVECASPIPACDTARLDPGKYNVDSLPEGSGPLCVELDYLELTGGSRSSATSGANVAPVFANNIVLHNATPLSFTQISGDHCGWVFSDIALVPPIPMIGGNLVVDPQFVDALHGDFHRKETSPVRSAADPAAMMAVGEARPQGPGREMGADEIK